MFWRIRSAVKARLTRVVAFVATILRPRPRPTLRNIGSADAGGGSCLMWCDNGLAVAIDCGASPSNKNGDSQETAERIVAEIVATRPKFLVISHFHYDHWGVLTRLVIEYRKRRIPLPAIVCTDITWKLLERYLFEDTRLSMQMLVNLGFRAQSDKVKLIPNKHSVPGSVAALLLGTKNVLYTSDFWALDLPDDLPSIDVLVIDVTGAEDMDPHEDIEMEARTNIMSLATETLKGDAGANTYVAMFSTHLERATWLEREIQALTGNLPMINGRSLVENLKAVRQDVGGYHTRRFVLTTGAWAQGQAHWDGMGSSALVRMANGTDRRCRLKPGDTVIISASIPMWSRYLPAQIREMCLKIRAFGVRVVVDISAPEKWEQLGIERRKVHSGGHGSMHEIADTINRVLSMNRGHSLKVLPFHASPEAREKVAEYCRGRGISVISDSQLPEITL